MSRNEEIAMVLRAAAQGYLEPYYPMIPAKPGGGQCGGGGGVGTWVSFDGKSYDAAKSVAGALNAIAAVYEGMAKAESAKSTEEAMK